MKKEGIINFCSLSKWTLQSFIMKNANFYSPKMRTLQILYSQKADPTKFYNEKGDTTKLYNVPFQSIQQ